MANFPTIHNLNINIREIQIEGNYIKDLTSTLGNRQGHEKQRETKKLSDQRK